jgi:hypothetical protein
LIHGCPTLLVTGLLAGIQDGLAPWILDDATKFGERKSSILANSVRKTFHINFGEYLIVLVYNSLVKYMRCHNEHFTYG